MLSGILQSARAIEVNIFIMRAFVRLQEYALTYRDLEMKIEELENRYDNQFKTVFDALRELTTPPAQPRRRIGIDPSSSDPN